MIRAVCLGATLAITGPYAANVVHIPARLNERLSSQDAKTGDTFSFDTTASAEVDGEFLPARSHGRGVVVLAKSARGPQPGVLELEARTLDMPDGTKLEVGLDPGQLDEHITPFSISSNGETNVVYEKGTAFTVVAPPPPTPEPEPSAG